MTGLGRPSFAAVCCTAVLTGAACGNAASVTARHAIQTGRVALADADLYYRAAGSGPPVLLLHGFMWSGRTWERFVDAWASKYTLIMPDLPGHGLSTGLPTEWRHRRLAEQMFEFLDSLGHRRVRAVGCSTGATTLLHMALQQPDRIEALVLVSGSHRMVPETRAALPTVADEPAEFREWNRTNIPGGASQTQALLNLLRHTPDTFEDLDLGRLAKITAPTLLAWGDRDGGDPVEVAVELYRALPAASLWVVPNAGHCPFWEGFPGFSREGTAAFPRVVASFFGDGREP